MMSHSFARRANIALGVALTAAAAGVAPTVDAQRKPPAAAVLFAERTERFGVPQPCAATQEGCYSHHVVSFDIDGDRDLDVVFASGGGYYEPAQPEPMAVYVNDGRAGFRESSQTATGGFAGRLRQVAVGDIDRDGDLDLLAPDAYGLQPDAVFVNDGSGVFANEGGTRLGTTSRAGATRLGDLDADGDLDLVITDWGTAPPGSPGTAKIYLNDGVGVFAELRGAMPIATETVGTGPIDADLLDIDGDFDLDLLLASREGESLLFVNRGDGTFEDASSRFPDQPGPYVYGPDACDVDADGDLDLWLDNGGPDASEQLLLNESGVFHDDTAQRVRGNLPQDDNQVRCVDYDADGDFDALVASLSDVERFFRNDGVGQFEAVPEGFPRLLDSTLGLDLGDLDGDGRLDAVTAQGEGGDFRNRLYLGTEAQAVDARAPVLRAVERPSRLRDGQLWVRFAVSDRVTTDVGPRLERAWLETLDGVVIDAEFIGGDLFLAIVPNVAVGLRYRACAEDLSGNTACSGEQRFSLLAAVPTPESGVDAGGRERPETPPPSPMPGPTADGAQGVQPSVAPVMTHDRAKPTSGCAMSTMSHAPSSHRLSGAFVAWLALALWSRRCRCGHAQHRARRDRSERSAATSQASNSESRRHGR